MKRTRNKYHYEYKKCLRAGDRIRRSRLLDACVNGGADLFSEIKQMRKSERVLPTTMDGNENVKEVFVEKYKKLYNSTDDAIEVLHVQSEIESMVNERSIMDV